MIDFYAYLAPRLKKTYVYNGDTGQWLPPPWCLCLVP